MKMINFNFRTGRVTRRKHKTETLAGSIGELYDASRMLFKLLRKAFPTLFKVRKARNKYTFKNWK